MSETKHSTYQPLLRVAVAVSAGIVVDRVFGVDLLVWLGVAGLVSFGWLLAFRSRRFVVSSLFLLIGFGSAAAAWHNLHWNWWATPEIGSFASDDRSPVVIRGRIKSQPRWGPATSAFRKTDDESYRTRFNLEVKSIRCGQEFEPTAGTVQVFVSDRADDLKVGDQIQLVGSLSSVPAPTNPGSFDFQQHFRGQRILCWVNAESIEAVTVVSSERLTGSFVSGLRKQMDDLIWQYLDKENAALASAMLLGNRNQLERLRRDEFMLSGTVHLLAISGLHVGILATMFLVLPRIGLAPRRFSLLATVLFVFGYAWVVEFRPPVLRAAILITVYCYCRWVGRQPFSFNSLAFAALVVMIVNPADLFRVGAQLSFLAVGSMIFASHWFFRTPSEDPIDRLLVKSRSLIQRVRDDTLRKIGLAFAVSGIIWLIAMPLVAAKFHVVAPIALIANPLLLIPVAVSLFCGLAVILFGGWLAPVAAFFATGCAAGLWVIQATIDLCQNVPYGHFWSNGPFGWSLLCLYSVLLVTFLRWEGLSFRIFASCFLFWLVAGWIVPDQYVADQAKKRTSAVCTFGDVGHGVFVLMQLPGGKNVVYDCGCFGSPRRAQQVAAGVLWQRRIKEIDTLFISHADSDHFNGLPELVKQFSIKQIVVSNCMLNKAATSSAVARLFDELKLCGAEICTASEGQQFQFGESVSMRVLNPPLAGNGESDNSDSLVVDVCLNERRLLLTGDVERIGLDSLLQRPVLPCDIAMAPHHGSRNSRPADFIRWSQPRYLVISSGRGRNTNLRKPGTASAWSSRFVDVFHTGYDGAVQFEIDEDGVMKVTAWNRRFD